MRRPRALHPDNVGVVGLGVAVLALAFGLRPVAASEEVFWLLAACAAGLILLGWTVWPARASPPADRRRTEGPKDLELVIAECRRVDRELRRFVDDRASRRPRYRVIVNGLRRWDRETAELYRRDFRAWITGVFDDVVECGGLSPTARPLVETPTGSQLETIADLFRDAAKSLERDIARNTPA